MSKISAVLFDYGQVLSAPPAAEAWEQLKALFNAEEDVFHPAYWTHRHEYDRGTLNAVQYWNAVAEVMGKQVTEAQIGPLNEADVALWTQPNQEMIDWAAALQGAGVKTGILSNIGDAMEEGVLRHCPWLYRFHHHTFSHRLLIAKPEVAIYLVAASGLGVPTSEVLFIDDREDNIDAARTVGMTAIQYLSHPHFVDEMKTRGLESWLEPQSLKLDA